MARTTTRLTRRIAALAVVILLLALTGCSAGDVGRATFTFRVFQYRSDYAPRQVQIEVVNTGTVDVRVTSATFDSDWFSHPVSSTHTPSQVLAKGTTDFPVVLAPAACTATAARPVVTIGYTASDGSSGRVRATPSIPFDSLTTVHAQDCSRYAFEKVATISPAAALRFETVDGKPVALLDVTITPTGAAGTVTLISTEDTTLLAQREGQLRDFGLTFSASAAPTTITLDYVPTRCEEHVIAEDKVGTVIPVRANAGEYRDALFGVAVSPAVKIEFYEWFARYCGWQG